MDILTIHRNIAILELMEGALRLVSRVADVRPLCGARMGILQRELLQRCELDTHGLIMSTKSGLSVGPACDPERPTEFALIATGGPDPSTRGAEQSEGVPEGKALGQT